jgi:hypothetical protein
MYIIYNILIKVCRGVINIDMYIIYNIHTYTCYMKVYGGVINV